MLSLGNDELALTILDPVDDGDHREFPAGASSAPHPPPRRDGRRWRAADEDRLGTRYVSGGYVYQVEDARLGPLFSGPAYPRDPPPAHDGQGLPEAFRPMTDPGSGKRLVIGNAVIADEGTRGSEHAVLERCRWRTEHGQVRLRMATTQQLGAWSLNLYREICLTGREIASSTRVVNRGAAPLPLVWYAHPFFPWPADGVCCRFSRAVTVADNPGLRVNADGLAAPAGSLWRAHRRRRIRHRLAMAALAGAQIERIAAHDWQKGQFVQIEGVAGQRLEAVQRHPTRGEVTVSGDFEMSHMPIWGNACTLSFEPYLTREVPAGAELAWSLTYRV